jgi:hypothetical protein
VERKNWEDELIWSFNYSSPGHHHHHDIEPMPNGNILIIAWEKKSVEEALAAGRDPQFLSSQGIWPDHIVEVTPIGEDSAVIVWRWHAWDHIIQDYDDTKPNYGEIADHPELINLNYPESNAVDWLHTNSIDYNQHLDQILLSAHNFDEIWIIDHSTTTEEAASHNGGKSGRGGDLLYRWGNPGAYGRGTEDDRVFGGQHDAKWVEQGYPGEGQISVYNNNRAGVEPIHSSVDFITTPLDSNGRYLINDGVAYEPTEPTWSYKGLPDNLFHSTRISGAQRLFNGNTLICVGNEGRFFEVTLAQEIVWDYISPVSGMTIVSQGTNPILNDVFRSERYSLDYAAFEGRDLTPSGPLELDPLPLICPDTTSGNSELTSIPLLQFFPNPVGSWLIVKNADLRSFSLDIFAGGHLISQLEVRESVTTIWTDSWPSGLYFLRCTDLATNRSSIVKLLKL